MTTQQLLKKLVSIPSSFPHEKEVGDFIADYLKVKGFRVKKVMTGKDRPNVVATYGNASTYLGFYGHMDTVPNNFEERPEPYKLKITQNIARGLGVEDMKGGIAALLQTGEYAVKNNLPIKLIFGVDEEDISQGAHDLVDSGLLRDITFLVVGESGQVPKTAKHFTSCFGRKGRILFIADIKGKKAHAAESEKGVSAAEKAVDFVSVLRSIPFIKHPRLGKTQIVIHSITSKTDSFSIPDTAQITFSLLTTPGVTSSAFLKDLKQKIKKAEISADIYTFDRKTPYGESYEVDLKTPFLKVLQKEVYQKYNVTPMYTSSVADENVFANRLKIPVISLGPLGGGGHTSDEWIDLTSLETVENVYKQILQLFHKK